MLTQIDVVCDTPFFIPVTGAKTRDSLQLQGVTGLGPPDKDLYMGEYARDGGFYSGRRVGPRSPVMTIEINPNYRQNESMDGWRDILYKAFNDPLPTSDAITLILHDDVKEDRYLTGYCDKFSNEVFGSDNAVQISMMCPDPYIRDVDPIVISGSFTTIPFVYEGTADAGFEVKIQVTVATSTITLSNNQETMLIVYGPGFQVNDEIYINTIAGQRVVQFKRGATTYDILFALYSESPWMFLHKSSNSLKVYGETEASAVAAITNLEFTQTWWGL